MRRRFLLIHNPFAGSRGSTLTARTVAALEAHGATVERAGLDTLKARASGGGFDAVIAAGGDGTFRATAAALDGLDLPIGVIPAGTGNVLAAEIGLPRQPHAIAGLLREAPVVRLAAGRANGAPFHLMVGAGFDGEVIRRLSPGLKQKLGKLAYSGPILASLARRPEPLAVTIDGQRHAASWVVAAKARRYAGTFIIAPSADLTGTTIEVALFAGSSPATRAAQLIMIAAGHVEAGPGVTIVRGRDIRITSAAPVPVEADGDAFGTTPLEIDALGPRARLIVPELYLAGRNLAGRT